MNDEEAYSRLATLCEVIDRWAAERDVFHGPQVGSRLASDDALTDPYHLSHAVDVSISTALDHLRALRALLVDAQALHMAAPFTLTRAAIENAARALWLLTPDAQDVRVARRLQMCVQDAKERDTADALLGATPTGRYTLAARKDRFAGMAEAAGVDRQRVLQRPPGFSTIVSEASDHVGSDLPLEYLWRLGSGYAHGQPWSVLTAGAKQRIAGSGTHEVPHYEVTADAPTVLIFTGAAVLALKEALDLQRRHRLAWRTSTRPSP